MLVGMYTPINTAVPSSLKQWGELLLPSNIKETIADFIGYEEEITRLERFFRLVDVVRKNPERLRKLRPRLSALLYGPPGTGKTMSVKVMAKKYNLPLLIVHSDRLISKGLGDTLHNIRNLLDSCLEWANNNNNNSSLIIFFDELDAIASERSSEHEVGEIKRAVTTFLQHLDRTLETSTKIAIIGATNHSQMLDTAVWRRFSLHISFNFPDEAVRWRILEYYMDLLLEEGAIIVGSNASYKYLASDHITKGYTAADIRRAMENISISVLLGEEITPQKLETELKLAGGTGTYYKEYQRERTTVLITERNENLTREESHNPEIIKQQEKTDSIREY